MSHNIIRPLPILHSVQKLSQKWETGMRPVLVLANDLRPYVAKHNRGMEPCSRLCNELLAYHYARIWGLPVLDAALIRVAPSHVGELSAGDLQPGYFKHTCFATEFRRESVDLNVFLRATRGYEKQRYTNRADLLRIALFDLWLANEDRTLNNPNILVTADVGGFTLRVMDHEAIFGSNNPGRELPALTIGDSLLAHPALAALLGANFSKDPGAVAGSTGDAYLWVRECERRTDDILSSLPADWSIEVATFRQQLQERLFDPQRLSAVLDNFNVLLAQC